MELNHANPSLLDLSSVLDRFGCCNNGRDERLPIPEHTL